MYNKEIKERFLEQFENLDTKEVYSRIFKKSINMEVENNTDLMNFNEHQLEKFLKELKPKTKESARTYCNIVSSFIQWGIDNNMSIQSINFIKRRQDYFYEFVERKKLYISLEEKNTLVKNLVNRQDGFIIQGLWEGIEGTRACELTGLTTDDLRIEEDDKGEERFIARLRDKEGNVTRELEIEEDTFNLAILANKEVEYYKMNGEVDFSDNIKDTVRLLPSVYVLKVTKNRKKSDMGGQVSHYTIYNRLEMIRELEEFKEYSDALVSKNILRSGMIYHAMLLLKRDGELGRKQIEEVCQRYNIKYKWSLRDFLNVNTINSLYPDR